MNTTNVINFRIYKSYSNLSMKNSFFDIASVFSVNAFTGYTIFEIINSTAFPIILAIGSLVLTIILIVVQLRKLRLVSQQLKSEILETEKKELELKQLKDEEELRRPSIKLG